MNFKEMLLQAKAGRELAVMALLDEYYPPWEPPVSRLRATRN